MKKEYTVVAVKIVGATPEDRAIIIAHLRELQAEQQADAGFFHVFRAIEPDDLIAMVCDGTSSSPTIEAHTVTMETD